MDLLGLAAWAVHASISAVRSVLCTDIPEEGAEDFRQSGINSGSQRRWGSDLERHHSQTYPDAYFPPNSGAPKRPSPNYPLQSLRHETLGSYSSASTARREKPLPPPPLPPRVITAQHHRSQTSPDALFPPAYRSITQPKAYPSTVYSYPPRLPPRPVSPRDSQISSAAQGTSFNQASPDLSTALYEVGIRYPVLDSEFAFKRGPSQSLSIPKATSPRQDPLKFSSPPNASSNQSASTSPKLSNDLSSNYPLGSWVPPTVTGTREAAKLPSIPIVADNSRQPLESSNAYNVSKPIVIPDGYALEADDLDEVPGEKFREKARKAMERSKELSKTSQEAYRSGQKAHAKTLSDQRKNFELQVKQYNALAAQAIFEHHNPGYTSGLPDLAKCDLHHLYVPEAKEFARIHLVKCKKNGLQQTSLIVGRGNGNGTGVSVLRPKMMEFLREQGLAPRLAKGNDGMIIVSVLDGTE